VPQAAAPASSDQTPKSTTPAPPTGATASADIKLPPAAPVVPSMLLPAQPPADPATSRSSADAATTLPQLVAKLAASGRAPSNGTTADAAADVSLATPGGTPADATAASGNAQLGLQTAPGFNPVVANAQTPPPLGPAQHAAGTADAVPLASVPFEIATRVEAGLKHFEIRLDPPDLGRIEVRLAVDSSGRATSHLVVDRADTLDLLRRDAPSLERALQSAGLTTDDGSLQFSLRDQSFAGRDQGTSAPLPPPPPAAVPDSEIAPIDAAVRRYGQLAGLGGGVDIRV
jgi:flagellar hook-length control protein FliK